MKLNIGIDCMMMIMMITLMMMMMMMNRVEAVEPVVSVHRH